MAKTALIERELKRKKLAAKYAAKYTELKAIAGDFQRTDKERAFASSKLSSFVFFPSKETSPSFR